MSVTATAIRFPSPVMALSANLLARAHVANKLYPYDRNPDAIRFGLLNESQDV